MKNALIPFRTVGKFRLRTGCFSCGAAVFMGAFGAHALKKYISDKYLLDVWNTAVLYHFIHSFGIITAALAPTSNPRFAAISFSGGIGLFSGSLYLMTLTNKRWLGAITPFGGALFIVGWGLLGWYK